MSRLRGWAVKIARYVIQHLAGYAVILALFFAAGVYLDGRARPKVQDHTTLLVELSGNYSEGPRPSRFAQELAHVPPAMVDLLLTLQRAETDERVEAVVFRVRELGVGWGKAHELRRAIERLREAGKKTVAFVDLEAGSAHREFYVASAAEEVVLAEGGRVPLLGLSAEFFYLGGLWEQVGVTLEVQKVGKYKSATENIAGKEMSAEAREVAQTMIETLNEQFVTEVGRSRGLSPEAVEEILSRGLRKPHALVTSGLADRVGYYPEIESQYDMGNLMDGAAYSRSTARDDAQGHVAIIYGSGGLSRGKGKFVSKNVVAAFEEAAKDPDVEAILFRVDSPGGSPLGAEAIWGAIERARVHKPVVASFADVAASAGYYAAASADEIHVEPGTLTGSIGVFAIRVVIKDVLAKLHVGFEALQMSPYGSENLSTKVRSPEVLARGQADIEDTYQLFVSRVATGRRMDPADVDRIARG